MTQKGRPRPVGARTKLLIHRTALLMHWVWSCGGAAMNPPVFLGAVLDCATSEPALKLVRAALAAHPRFFTSHLPADDEASLQEWALAMRETPCARRPVWLSTCAFGCIAALRLALPGARFVRVVDAPCQNDEDDCLELSAERLHADPQAELARVFAFLGERPLLTPVLVRRCA
jgi:hypothetical protein